MNAGLLTDLIRPRLSMLVSSSITRRPWLIPEPRSIAVCAEVSVNRWQVVVRREQAPVGRLGNALLGLAQARADITSQTVGGVGG